MTGHCWQQNPALIISHGRILHSLHPGFVHFEYIVSIPRIHSYKDTEATTKPYSEMGANHLNTSHSTQCTLRSLHSLSDVVWHEV